MSQKNTLRDKASAPLVADSVTLLDATCAGLPMVCASHGGLYSAAYALRLGVSGAAFSDAGMGRARAGVAGVEWLDDYDLPAFAVSHQSARIGDGADLWRRGVVSVANEMAQRHGIREGMNVQEAHALLPARPDGVAPAAPVQKEVRKLLEGYGGAPVVALDSVSLVAAGDANAIVITGSHGGLLGGDPRTAIKHPVFAAFYNDAGVGIDGAGITRLPALDARGIAGMTVDAWTARIGDGMSTYETGVVSHANETARSLGVVPGMSVKAASARLAKAWIQQSSRKVQ